MYINADINLAAVKPKQSKVQAVPRTSSNNCTNRNNSMTFGVIGSA